MTTPITNIRCPLCSQGLRFSIASSRRAKVKKHFIMLVCPRDARHFRGFISDQRFVGNLIAQTAPQAPPVGTGTGEGEAPSVESLIHPTTQDESNARS